MSNQKGFTLIELIVVIVILGILAATALPKFVDLSGDARGGVVKGVEAAMRGANTMIYGKAAAQGLQASSTASVTVNGSTVSLAYGYASNAVELTKVMDLSPATDFLSGTGSNGGTNDTNGYITHSGATSTNRKNCQVGYQAAASATTSPSYTRDISNCN